MDIDSPEASEQEMSLLVKADDLDIIAPEAKAEALPWTMAEELLAGELSPENVHTSSSMQALRFVLAMLVLASMVAPMARSSISAKLSQKESGPGTRYLV